MRRMVHPSHGFLIIKKRNQLREDRKISPKENRPRILLKVSMNVIHKYCECLYPKDTTGWCLGGVGWELTNSPVLGWIGLVSDLMVGKSMRCQVCKSEL